MAQDYDYLLKLIMIGPSGSGKSSILMRYADDQFTDNFIATIGVDFKIKTFDNQGSTVKLQIWDTAGQERFKTIVNSYYSGAHAVILTIDLTDEDQFENIQTFIDDIYRFATRDTPVLLVGNKCDLIDQRQVSEERVQEFADAMGWPYILASAKTNYNIDEIFESISSRTIFGNRAITPAIETKEKAPILPIPSSALGCINCQATATFEWQCTTPTTLLCIDCLVKHTEDKSPEHRIIPFRSILAHVNEHCNNLKTQLDENRKALTQHATEIIPTMRQTMEEMQRAGQSSICRMCDVHIDQIRDMRYEAQQALSQPNYKGKFADFFRSLKRENMTKILNEQVKIEMTESNEAENTLDQITNEVLERFKDELTLKAEIKIIEDLPNTEESKLN